jgi:transmembrane sensor
MTGGAALAREQAADWIVRLDRASGEDDARALEAWLDGSEGNQDAFARLHGLWDDLGALPARAPAKQAMPLYRRWMPRLAAVAAAVLLVFAGVMFNHGKGGALLRTDVGGRDIAMLEDGSRVTLNTDTELRVAFARAERTVILDRGEAMFEVRHDVDRPFVVEAAGRRVTAVGTTFVVRRYTDGVAVTLVEGRVKVEDSSGTRFVSPGERLILRDGGRVGVDRPVIDSVTSWRRGELVFHETLVSDAIAEMNRYTRKPIRLTIDPGNRRLSGIFATSGTRQFGQLVAELYDWDYHEEPDSAVLRQGAGPSR